MRKSLWKSWGMRAIGFAGAVAIVFLAGRLAPPAPHGLPTAPDLARLAVFGGGVALAYGWAMFWMFRAFRKLDEFEQEAVKFAIFHGGYPGIMVSGLIFILLALSGFGWAEHRPLPPPLFIFYTGFLLPVLGLGLGAGVVRLWWRFNKR